MKEIADRLFLSQKTVQAHREHLKEKLNLKSSAELIRFAVQNSPDALHHAEPAEGPARVARILAHLPLPRRGLPNTRAEAPNLRENPCRGR